MPRDFGRGLGLMVVLMIGWSADLWAQEQIEYYGTDAIGSIRIVFDASGTVKGRMDFGPFGEELVPNTGMGQAVFAKLFRDPETGLDYAVARLYQARTGRFNAMDPADQGFFDSQGSNRYTYAMNSPAVLVDPVGLAPILITCGTSTTREDWRMGLLCLQQVLNQAGLVTRPLDEIPVPGGRHPVPLPPNQPPPTSPAPPGAPPPGAPPTPSPGPTNTPTNVKIYPRLTAEQCKALSTVLDREAQFGTPRAARMSSNTFGDSTIAPFNSTFVPNLRTPEGELDLDWYTDLAGYGLGLEPVVYPVAKTVWTVTRFFGGMGTGNALPFQDPGERTAFRLSFLDEHGYKDIFTPSYMAQVCPK